MQLHNSRPQALEPEVTLTVAQQEGDLEVLLCALLGAVSGGCPLTSPGGLSRGRGWMRPGREPLSPWGCPLPTAPAHPALPPFSDSHMEDPQVEGPELSTAPGWTLAARMWAEHFRLSLPGDASLPHWTVQTRPAATVLTRPFGHFQRPPCPWERPFNGFSWSAANLWGRREPQL